MNLSALLSSIRTLPEYAAALEALPGRSSFALGLLRAARPPIMAALAEDARQPVLILAARADRAVVLAEELSVWLTARPVLQFSEPNLLFYEPGEWGPRTIRARLSALAALVNQPDTPPIIVASARALMTRTTPKGDFLAQTQILRAGQTVRLEKLLASWTAVGYSSETTVVEPGQFARRGGIIDIFPSADDFPARLELFGDEIESLRQFDPASQRSGSAVESLTVTPAREFVKAEGASILEYLPPDARVMVDDWQELAEAVGELEEQAVQLRAEQVEADVISPDCLVPYHAWAELQDELTEHAPVILAASPNPDVPAINLGAHFHPGPRYGGQLKPLMEHLSQLRAEHQAVAIVTRQAQRLAELWGEQTAYLAPVESVTEPPAAGTLVFVSGALSEGWRLDYELGRLTDEEVPSSFSLHLLTDAEIFGWAKPQARRRHVHRADAPEANYADFAPGDFVVHADFGIGRFSELVRRAIDSLEREYLRLEYADGDELYVPIYQTDRLTRYIGAGDHPPTLARLGSAEWLGTKAKAQQAADEVAKDLLELYAKRELAPGHACGPDTPWQAELEASFPYVETEDQLHAIHDVKADMERARPMDRLICGDVGYGKTEVALRAAFKAVMNGTQTAILVPTTVLAQQHFQTFQARLAPYPVTVEMLSRFRSRAEADAILAKLAEGKVDILIGTHRLLQKDVQFKNMGLLIIDEEQRFGVTHKERLKKMRTEVDVLTLTATPIPRTLYMSLTGVRDISTINTPPEERLPVTTYSGPHDERLVRQAILRELDRNGQVFFVHNRVQSIGVIRQKLERLVPEARLGVAHGQMDEHELSRMMDQFTHGEIDILLCTSIIESGLDIPNANTLIVDRADMFGLAQLYQLRGRVGRGAARAYAYFFTDRRHRPTEEARERLDTIAEQTELGAGYSIAMRDLEIRGAGDLLGARQSGHIAAVGFHLYTRLLAESVKRLKSQITTPQTPAPALVAGVLDITSVDLPLPLSIPADYVGDKTLRLQLYRRLANLTDEGEVAALGAELADRFGALPEPVENLLYQLRVKIRAVRARVNAVSSEAGTIVLTLPPREGGDYSALTGRLGPGARVSKNRIWLPRAANEAGWREQLLDVLDKLAVGLVD